MPLAPGSRLGRYVIVRQLGAGAMGEVYLAEDPHIERRVALKTVRFDLQEGVSDATREQMRLRFQREAKAAGRLVHQHVVTLFDAGDVDGVFFLAFEFVDGADLAARARAQPPLTLREIIRIGREAASALDAAHRVGIVHRDIKPANLLLTRDGILKIADFGIATLIEGGSHLTQTGLLVGTPQYLSPEQVTSETPLDGRSDLFSVGVVLYELLGGRRPFDGSTMAALLYSVVSKDPVPLSRLRPDLPPRLSAAVMRLLSKNRDERFASASAVGAELELVERELGSAPAVAAADAPTLIVNVPTTPGTTQHVLPPATMRQDVITPATYVEAPRGRSTAKRGLTTAVVVVMLVAGGGYAWWKARVDQNAAHTVAEPQPSAAVTPPPIPARSETVVAAVPATVTEAESAREARRVVGNAISVEVSPSEVSADAIVKVDGLVRGLAGSLMTLKPGPHAIEVVAPGYEPTLIEVEAREDAPTPSVVAVTLVRRSAT